MTRKIISPEKLLPETQTKEVPLELIDQNENSRVVYKVEDLSELMQSMNQSGLFQPVGLRADKEGRYDAVFGNRRIIAARKLGWYSIRATIVQADTENDRDILNLTENFKRRNTSIAEDGRMFKILLSRGLQPSELASRLGITKERINAALSILESVDEDLQKKIVRNAGHHNRAKKGMIPA